MLQGFYRQIGFVGLLSLMLLSGCAHSPQQLVLAPSVSLNAESYGGGRTVSLSIEDRRASKVVGSRGGVYEETALITIANDPAQALEKPAKARLAAQGFAVNADQAAQLTMVIGLQSIEYQVLDSKLGQQIAVTVSLDNRVSYSDAMSEQSFSGQYRSVKERRFPIAPSNEANAEMINEALTETLERLFDDPKLRAFLQ